MEILEQQSVGVLAGKSKLRYPLRSASKSISKDMEKPQVSIPSSAPRRDRAPSTLSKSVGVLQLSGEDNSARPRSVAATALKPPAGNITTPISETRVKRSATKNDTPLSNTSMPSTQKKFNAIAVASYWLLQIKISEYVAKRSISLALFKLALEAGCEYFRHQERALVSKICSHLLPEDVTRSSDDEFHSSLSRKPRPRSLNAGAAQVFTMTESTNKETSQRKNTTTTRTLNKNTENSP
uniref:Uncharacterized protein n=1 Tax=Salix viminalis TaxID=40686 RepID=A0A6N2N2J2_SALVM